MTSTAGWRVTDTREGGNGGTYYTVNAQSAGALDRIPVTVKHTKYGTLVCLTCRSADVCIHAGFVAGHLKRESPAWRP